MGYIWFIHRNSLFFFPSGLGDRHGENLLLDCSSGRLVQVDFDCLFDKGTELACPERVPFRLTQNMIDAFGVNRVEGSFRRSCEMTMAVIRHHRDLLINVLYSFISDPLVEWEKGSQHSGSAGAHAMALQDAAIKHMDKIEKRLRGQIGMTRAVNFLKTTSFFTLFFPSLFFFTRYANETNV
jgi:serine/threonine-protein kinase ATR